MSTDLKFLLPFQDELVFTSDTEEPFVLTEAAKAGGLLAKRAEQGTMEATKPSLFVWDLIVLNSLRLLQEEQKKLQEMSLLISCFVQGCKRHGRTCPRMNNRIF